jgi:hypothetical protein
VVSIFAAVGVLFVPVGAVCLAEALSVRLRLICVRRRLRLPPPTRSAPPAQVVEVVQRYDDTCASGATPALREAALQQVRAAAPAA